MKRKEATSIAKDAEKILRFPVDRRTAVKGVKPLGMWVPMEFVMRSKEAASVLLWLLAQAKHNERTSPRVAKIAARVLAEQCGGDVIVAWLATRGTGMRNTPLYWSDIRALAASALTQTADIGRGSKAAGGKSPLQGSEPHKCTPAARSKGKVVVK